MFKKSFDRMSEVNSRGLITISMADGWAQSVDFYCTESDPETVSAAINLISAVIDKVKELSSEGVKLNMSMPPFLAPLVEARLAVVVPPSEGMWSSQRLRHANQQQQDHDYDTQLGESAWRREQLAHEEES